MRRIAPFLTISFLPLLGVADARAAVYTVGVDGTFEQILGPGSPVLADGDVVQVPAGIYSLASWPSPTLAANISLLGEGPGATVVEAPTAFAGSFLTVAASLRISGLTLRDFGDALVLSPPFDETVAFEARRLEIDGGSRLGDGSGNRGIVATFGSDLDTGTLGRVSIEDCHFHDLDDAGINLRTRNIDSAKIAGNLVENVGLAGISVGFDGQESDRDQYASNLVVSGNRVIGVHALAVPGIGERTFGIAVFGRETTIQGNVLRSLDLSVPAEDTNGKDRYVGIYTKAAYATLGGNVIRDPAPGYAISIKGLARGGGDVNPGGFMSIVANNQVLVSDPAGRRFSGMKINCDDVTVQGNHFEGTDHEAIVVQTQATDDISVLGNTFIHTGLGDGPGWGVAVNTSEAVSGAMTPGDRRLLISDNRFVGFAGRTCDPGASLPCEIVNRFLPSGGGGWQFLPAPTAPGEWLVTDNIVK